MRFGVFDDFKSERTLLVWTDVGGELKPLVDGLDELARGPRTTIRLDASLGAGAVGGAQVSIEVASQDAVILREDCEGPTVQLRCSRASCSELADQLRGLVTPPYQVGHHYLDLTADQPVQIMVSAGEYPADLKP
jgi:hypothetical protein